MNRWIAAALLGTTSCIPIPVNKTFVVWPERKMRVVDAAGKPVAHARVSVVRVRHPHSQVEETRILHADENGELATRRESKTLKVFPLMMHGVPGFSFEACAEAKGFAATTVSWSNPDEPKLLELKLVEGSRPCEHELDQTPPPSNKLRIESIEKQNDGRFLVVVAMAPGTNITTDSVGKDGAEPLKIVEVAWQSPAGGPIRRARVYVTGDALAYEHGDLMARR